MWSRKLWQVEVEERRKRERKGGKWGKEGGKQVGEQGTSDAGGEEERRKVRCVASTWGSEASQDEAFHVAQGNLAAHCGSVYPCDLATARCREGPDGRFGAREGLGAGG